MTVHSTRETRAVADQHVQLNKLVVTFVLSNGGKWRNEEQETLSLPTVAGDLRVHVVDDWIACCFDDVDRACAHFGVPRGQGYLGRLNACSGKWNWGCGERLLADYLFHNWSVAVQKLLLAQQQ